VFPLLTKYLLIYKKVSIPNIGSFSIEQQPAELNFIDRLLMPPHYKIVFNNNNAVDEELVNFIGNSEATDSTTARQKLEHFGNALKNKLLREPFEWNGIGKLEYADGIVFHPKKVSIHLQPVPANRVIRENQQHTVLVGEQEYQSGDMEQTRIKKKDAKKKLSMPVLVGSVLLVLALAFIGYHFYKQRHVNEGTGFKTVINPNRPSSTYK